MNVGRSFSKLHFLLSIFLWLAWGRKGGSALNVIACLPRGAACWDTPLSPTPPPPPHTPSTDLPASPQAVALPPLPELSGPEGST